MGGGWVGGGRGVEGVGEGGRRGKKGRRLKKNEKGRKKKKDVCRWRQLMECDGRYELLSVA